MKGVLRVATRSGVSRSQSRGMWLAQERWVAEYVVGLRPEKAWKSLAK